MLSFTVFLGLVACAFAQKFNLTVNDRVSHDFDIPLRIVNGVEAQKGEFPFIARLTVFWPNGDAGLCGGSLLNQKFVLTAAHCFYHPVSNEFANQVLVYLGDHNIRVNDAARVSAQGVNIVLNGYDGSTHYNDVAIIELSKTVAYTNAIKNICINRAGTTHVGQTATAAGWGALGSDKPTSDVLRKVQLPVLADSVCTNSYHGGYYNDVMVCAGYIDATKDTCQGDSGGPLFLTGAGGFTLIGATSFGFGCAARGFPGVYARVASFNDWIRDTAGNICEN